MVLERKKEQESISEIKVTTFNGYTKDNDNCEISNKTIEKNIEDESFKLISFKNIVAKKIIFTNVDFSNCIFDNVYVRDCIFESCRFTGSKFINSNLKGSAFSNCDLRYALFEKTFVDNDIFDLNLPREENLQRNLIRSLRVNYQQIGDTASVNKAIILELNATSTHLKHAWCSEKDYYRKKYKGFNRLKVFTEWLIFVFLDKLWGNGESVLKLFRSTIIILLCIAIIDHFFIPGASGSFLTTLFESPETLFGISDRYSQYNGAYKTAILLVRLIMFAFFISIVVKRLNRR